MQQLVLLLLVLAPVSFAFADESRPNRRGCQRQLVAARFIEPAEAQARQAFLEAYERGTVRGGEDVIYVDRYDGSYDARDPGDF